MTGATKAPRPPAQQPRWAGGVPLADVVGELATRPPLVSAESCYALQRELSLAAAGGAVVVQAGDCAEPFADADRERMTPKVELLGAIADVVESVVGLPAVRVGRFAGQYAKPRSRETERLPDGRTLPVYRGDAVNGTAPTPEARTPDPTRLLAAYDHAALALDALRLAEFLPVFEGPAPSLCLTYASHEALLLDYEDALVRDDDRRGGGYGSSGHLLWIGERTRQVDGPHIAFAERVTNPVGVKVGPDASGAEVGALITRLTEGRPRGRLSLIVRMGPRIVDELPRLLGELGDLAARALWISDPMHGNTRRNHHGQKTRLLPDIEREIRACGAALRAHGLPLGGVHLETTPEPVVECVETEADLATRLDRYTSTCDPRLNAEQALAVARVAAEVRLDRPPVPTPESHRRADLP
ncbi:3-deoxy-7-phosphoheptulonate synthase [Streptomyces radicis]|uniref:Phospho-2-dehydro-3-deoxyheptonate aldolase n=1 Tax=Streptomyces radicis TaxID=1750517 RepID=A0A3A9VWG3_9ACTN|nr:3-deoxy-7-phosphoheptulonate synthase [Streptomyces radicis]RKN04513.1 3-deoxy-7-phosphoheptulonate synthase [Streptomyces radicis]RKN15491.1 3-deoxy-7-phosphoheptulonate synthase [Streptomyces radicis]